jgi:hypothetical protein
MYFFRKNKSSEKAIILNMTELLMLVLYVAKPPVQTIGLPANKVMVRFHKILLSAGSKISFVFPPHKLFFRTLIYQHGSIVNTYLANYCIHAKVPT